MESTRSSLDQSWLTSNFLSFINVGFFSMIMTSR